MYNIHLTDYFKYRIEVRGFDLKIIECILKESQERYFDNKTRRLVVIGKHRRKHVLIPIEIRDNIITPVTIHVIDRRQVTARIKNGRFVHEQS